MLKVNRFNVGKAEDKGSKFRELMEDKSVIIQDLNVSENLDFSFFAVFDGHGGTLCVRHVAEYLPTVIREYLLKSDVTDIDMFDKQEHFYSFIKKIIVQSIQDTDFSFFDESGEYSLSKGCTAVIVMIVGDRVICANVGDSRAILSRNRVPICLSKDHKPNNPSERERINNAGGKVEADRVNGVLATSRSFGDFKFKVVSHFTNAFKTQGNGEDIVTSKPEIRVHQIDWSKDEFIVIGCDGLYDNLTNTQIVEFVHDKLTDYEIGM
jgi:protein phosphatase 2C family protein 2/3